MLIEPGPTHSPPPQSIRQEYEAFIEQRIEEFKEQMSRQDLLALADEAVRDLRTSQTQFVLTEVLLHEQVDRLIRKRLRLPSFRRWQDRHAKLRRAQQVPTHWGLHPDGPVPSLIDRLETRDLAVVVGHGSIPVGLFLAAHDVRVLFLDDSLQHVEAAERRAAQETLSGHFEALVVALGTWFPDQVFPAIVVHDTTMLGRLPAATRRRLIETTKHRTVPGGVHLFQSAEPADGVVPLAPEALRTQYVNWTTEWAPEGSQTRWFTARKPDRQS